MKSITVILLSGETISYSVEGSIKFFDGQLSFYSPVLKKEVEIPFTNMYDLTIN